MSCLIYASNSDGCTGKCDANCYDATGPECNCICNGMNHGKGLKQAQDNTRKYAEKWIEQYAEKHNLSKNDIHVNKDIYQLNLFIDENSL